jgi:hypothetical protein
MGDDASLMVPSCEAFSTLGCGERSMRTLIPACAFLAACSLSAAAFAEDVAQAAEPADDFAPGLLLGVLFLLAVVLVLIGIGIIIGLVCVAFVGAMLALGLISSSALVAILRGRLSAGCRALHYQTLALIGVPFGIGVVWLGLYLCGTNLGTLWICLLGSAAGVLTGLCVAWILDRLAQLIYRRLVLFTQNRELAPVAGSLR